MCVYIYVSGVGFPDKIQQLRYILSGKQAAEIFSILLQLNYVT